MIEPVELKDFFIAFFSSAAIVLSGALYAMLFAWSRLRGLPYLMPLAYAAYAGLAVATLTLANALHLGGFWQVVTASMLIGYLLAPHGIWHLCVGTHCEPAPEEGGPTTEEHR